MKGEFKMKKIVMMVGFLLMSSRVFAAGISLTGIYNGSMHLTDGGVIRDIPLAVALTLTDETTPTPNGNQYIIDGQFVVDEEGGPYAFTKTTYDVDNNRLDLKYSRPRPDPTTVAPVSLRLVGAFASDNSISGSVTSGVYGPIGTFKVNKMTSMTSLPYRRKYVGRWEGVGKNVVFDKKRSVAIALQPSGSQTINPSNYEFEFTPGRICGYSADGTIIHSFRNVTIDYLRRKIVMADTGSMALDLSIDFVKNMLSGSVSSAAWGLTTTFQDLHATEGQE